MGITSIRLSEDVEEPLERLARKHDRSKNYLINQAIREYVLRHSMEELRWSETVEAIESVRSGHVVEWNQVAAWLESWGSEAELPPPKA